MSHDRDFASIGVRAPRKTFLDRAGSAGKPYSSVATAAGVYAQTARPVGAVAPYPPPAPASANEAASTKLLVLSEHRVELLDMLQEAESHLRNVYRTKFVFGDHLKFVDPSYGGDAVNQFNLTTPPVFDPAYASTPSTAQTQPQAPLSSAAPTQPIPDDAVTKEKLRTADEVIKKLYRRNTQLEVENKYLKSEVQRFERFAGLARESHNLCLVDGHLPLEHPLYTKRTIRHCRSCPPTRTLIRSAVDGFGLVFPPRGGTTTQAPTRNEDPLPVVELKKRVVALTEALVAVQCDNDRLQKEKTDRVSLRDELMKKYIAERDAHIAMLHEALQDIIGKVTNPMKLTRSRQPAPGMSPVVASANVLRDVAARLKEQVVALTDDLVRKASAALPPGEEGSAAPSPSGNSPSTRAPGPAEGAGNAAALASVIIQPPETAGHRKELTRRIRALLDNMPLAQRKQLLLMMSELKQLFTTLCNSNQSLLATYDQLKSRTNAEAIQLRLQVAMLKDQVRALGMRVDEAEEDGGGAATQVPSQPDIKDP